MENVAVVLLAGGHGTRLRHVFRGPKVLAPLNSTVTPLDLVMADLVRRGHRSFLLCAGRHEEAVGTHLVHHWERFLKGTIPDSKVGTAGTVRMALDRLPCERAVVANADTVFLTESSPVNLNLTSISVGLAHTAGTQGNVSLDDGRIVKYDKAGLVSPFTDAGRLMVVRSDVAFGSRMFTGHLEDRLLEAIGSTCRRPWCCEWYMDLGTEAAMVAARKALANIRLTGKVGQDAARCLEGLRRWAHTGPSYTEPRFASS